MIGDKIKKARKGKGMTLSECAGKASISKSYLSNMERNLNQNPSIQIIEKIAGVLEVEVATLIGKDTTDDFSHEDEWLCFIEELKRSGVKTHELKEFKSIIDYAKWRNSNSKET